ncbi:serine protease [Arthrobacter crystallopoietes BAB-32]|uniref:Serine protease n=1 Tax=Arthrobacter crystallopoietes BAB-32 TaxID=1246476 RepID=N1V7V5_9MICC|nr:S8 family serine peptidase [Arthrobacter crystallopoietes]EMY34303.1 serine protease [Arthrobacter crystallopoietes BAB-32]
MSLILRRKILSGAATATAAAMLGASLFTSPAAAAEQPGQTAYEQPEPTAGTDRIIVKFKDRAGSAARAKAYGRAAKELGLPVRELRTTATGAAVVETGQELDAADAQTLATELESDPAVDYAEPDIMMHPAATGPDPYYPKQWDLQDRATGLNAPAAWNTTEGAGQVVAVVDTGITPHADLDQNILPGYDMITSPDIGRDGNGRDSNPRDEGDWYDAGQCGSTSSSRSSWHGTHVAGTVAAVRNNAIGVSGAAPAAKVVPVRALGSCGGYMSDISDAVIWSAGGSLSGVPANANPADVVNLSLGGSGTCSVTFQSAIDKANALGAPVVVAAGNENTDVAKSTPANCANVITVAASGREGNRAPYSNYGSQVDVTAPGGDISSGSANGILSTFNTGTSVPSTASYAYMQGTSMAAPHVAATAALMLATNPALTPAQIEERLKATVRPGPGNCSQGCGAGLVDAAAAVKAAGAAPSAPAPEQSSAEEPVSAPAPVPAQEPLPSPAPQPTPTLQVATPSITGTAAVGRTLAANSGIWGPAPVTLSYQWHRSGSPIAGATTPSYTLAAADQGASLTVRVTGTKSGYTTATRESAATAPVAAGTLATSAPSISGTLKAGYTLTANLGTWTAGTTLRYQWYRGTSAISGATGRTYVLSGYDAGKRMSVKVTGSKPGYTTAVRYSAQTAAVAKGTLKTSAPSISGTTKAGYSLTASPGTWTAGTTLRYQWYRSGRAISGATASTYRLVSLDRYDTIKVRVTGYKTGYTTASRDSYSTAKIR